MQDVTLRTCIMPSFSEQGSNNTHHSPIQDYEKPLFGSNLGTTRANEEINTQLSQMLCLPVGASELLQINNMAGVGVSRIWDLSGL
ncbi:hypothetical protein DPMN_194338 [Dreissena polymorpha]|uniref:Uncharacterized protein n=1 Tax=Dreissena polymorpha TaxID=45954 RepID=A0A9D3Y570_DREPO|nr:hypothetical protein DPMN_194338 [Dreissena polymorpha]